MTPVPVVAVRNTSTAADSRCWSCIVDNTEIAAVFRDISSLLEKRKDNWFKIRAYRKVADSIEGLPVPVGQLVDERRLKEIPGVGEAITNKIIELVTTGNLEYYERLKTELREGTD